MAFSTAAYRLHTYVGGSFHMCDENFNVINQLRLRDIFHKPLTLLENATTYDDLARGLCSQSMREFNTVYSPEMTEWLFPEEELDSGLDIVALNVQRGRDHQIQGYTSYR